MLERKNIILGFFCLIICFFGLYKLNRDFLLLWNCNSLHITTEKPLNPQKVKIEFGISVNTINRLTDAELFNNREKYTLLYDKGSIKEEMINEYGENDFLITYNDQFYISFRQFKINRRHQHDYNFKFYEKNNQLFIQANIKGKDGMKFERPLLKIDSADKYRCNIPIREKRVVYNMIEFINPKN